MTIATDTDDLLSLFLWGEVVSIMRDTPIYDASGFPTSILVSVEDVNADIQRIAGNNPTRDLGQGRFSSHAIFMPQGVNIIQGDRIRSSDWAIGKAEFEVQTVMVEDGHVEVRTRLVRSSVTFLYLENGELILLETGNEIELE